MAPSRKKTRTSAPEYISAGDADNSSDDDLNAVLNYGRNQDDGNIGLDDDYSDDGEGLYSEDDDEIDVEQGDEEDDGDEDDDDGEEEEDDGEENDDGEEDEEEEEYQSNDEIDIDDGESFHGEFDDGDPNDIAQEDDEDTDEDDNEEEIDEQSGEDESASPAGPGRLGALARKLAALEEEIADIETKQISDKHWSMTGEVSAKNRPMNSLLEANVELPFGHMASKRLDESMDLMDTDDFDHTNPEKPKFDIELIIKQRVADRTFDDVIKRKIEASITEIQKPKDQYEGLDFEKSQLGLAEVYAKQYEKDIFNQSEEAEKISYEKEEARKVFAKLMHKLDSLTNYNFAPRPPMIKKAGADGNIKDLPAMKLEEPIPLIVSSSLRANQ